MTEVLTKMFGKADRVLVKDGKFNNVKGNYHHYDYTQRITNDGCHNIVGNTIHNVGNTSPQVIHHERGARSMHHARFATNRVATAEANAMNNHASTHSTIPQFQLPIRHDPPALLYSSQFSHQSPGQYIQARGGDFRQMSAMEMAFMMDEMAQMSQELDSEFGVDSNEEQNTLEAEVYINDTENKMLATTRSQSLSADFDCLAIEEGVSLSPRSALTHGLPSAVGADAIPQHIVISGDHTEVDDNFYSFNLNSHKVENNIVENSFGKGEQKVIEVQTTRRKLKQAHVPRRR